ncbi:YggS family pyridoxal phosphate-dependent enzyme [Sphingobacterium prati]|uniref:YggS family pyridoxal phosphate-dependent enzyme n=1 Tax=Sphingobacterium prati TaxID=2737006 RepID=UPI001553EF2F|nr:YggS family pyridoxal phosphate-dependent enzyme [Sphingobacterium prati]NPE45635.1 YggS family pyridoxal phosphate-dependent enzyme [Sphingobacterium prati]
MNATIIDNINAILRRIEKACETSSRDPQEVKLLLATKTVTAERIKIALQAGQTLIAENKVQELKEKYEDLQEIPHCSHFIGHLQTNKIKEILRYNISCVQSVDRLELAQKLHQRLNSENKSLDILIQVNTSYEKSKYGVAPDQVIDLVRQIATFSTLHIRGLMTIGLLSTEAEQIRKCFQLLKQIQQEIVELDIPNVAMQELSMGMSGDLDIAIAEGATIVRVGTAIFGQRNTPDSYYWNENKQLI